MSTKNNRISKIKNYLRMQSNPPTVTEIHEALVRRMGVETSRKTIERDMMEMEERRCVEVIPGTPGRYSLSQPIEVELCLKVEEIHFIISLLDECSDLHTKLAKLLL